MLNRLFQGIAALATLSSTVAAVRAGGTTVLLVAVLLAMLVIVTVIWAAIWSSDPDRREDALAVLDRLLRWKGRE